MTLEQQVTSLELSKRLRELGVKQESFFGWYFPNEDKIRKDEKWDAPNIQIVGSGNEWAWHDLQYSAFTVAELGELLPWYIESRFLEDADKWLEIQKDENVDDSVRWNVSYQDEMGTDLFEVFDSSEADARAKMLIYLLENKLITL